MTMVISIFSGLIGAIAYKYWNDFNEERVLITRGRSAIRGLAVLTQSISALEQRVRIFLDGEHTIGEKLDALEIVRYEELLSRFCNLQEQTINAVEEWKDIIPEAAIKTQIGVITELRSEKVTLEARFNDIQKELAATKEKSEEEVKALQQQLLETETNLAKVKSELREKTSQLGLSGVSGYSGLAGLIAGAYPFSPGIGLSALSPYIYDAKGSILSQEPNRVSSEKLKALGLEDKGDEKADAAVILEYLQKKAEPVTVDVIADELGLSIRTVLEILPKLIPMKVSREEDNRTGRPVYRSVNAIDGPVLEDIVDSDSE